MMYSALDTVDQMNYSVFVSGDQYLQMEIPEIEKYLWIWALFASYITPEIGTFLRSLRYIYFKGYSRQEVNNDRQWQTLLVTFTMETLHVLGLVIFVFQVLPNVDVVSGAMMTNCACLLPGILSKWPVPASLPIFDNLIAPLRCAFRGRRRAEQA